VQVGVLTNWLNLSAGYYNTLASKTDGTLWSWGRGSFGCLGLGNTTNYSSPKQIGALTSWLNVASAYFAGFAIKTNGTAWAWGQNNVGQLGQGNTTNYSSPMQIGALTNWSTISSTPSLGGSSTAVLAIKTDDTLWAWGSNAQGQLGSGNLIDRSSPVQVGALSTWESVKCFGQFVTALGY
jgi:alpha-tubulin suppressor-like RCC1 family protein